MDLKIPAKLIKAITKDDKFIKVKKKWYLQGGM